MTRKGASSNECQGEAVVADGSILMEVSCVTPKGGVPTLCCCSDSKGVWDDTMDSVLLEAILRLAGAKMEGRGGDNVNNCNPGVSVQ